MALDKETRAYEALSRLMKVAAECRVVFDEVGLEYPPPLRRILGEDELEAGNAHGSPRPVRISAPSVARPEGVPDGWVNVPMEAVNPQTVVLGVLRDATVPMTVKQVVAEVKARGTREVNDGSIANIGTRLEGAHVIERTDDGWALVDRSRAPLLNGPYAWGAPDVFMKQELAARRREAILHVLRMFPAGLMNMQIVERLESCTWLKTPLAKDLIKMDMEDLQRAEKVKRVGNTKKWVLATEQ
jgi:hypothetical protein